MILGPCAVCGRDIDSIQGHARRVCGWEAVRKSSGGANRIIDRAEMPGIAHTTCVEQRAARRRRGIADGQQALS